MCNCLSMYLKLKLVFVALTVMALTVMAIPAPASGKVVADFGSVLGGSGVDKVSKSDTFGYTSLHSLNKK